MNRYCGVVVVAFKALTPSWTLGYEPTKAPVASTTIAPAGGAVRTEDEAEEVLEGILDVVLVIVDEEVGISDEVVASILVLDSVLLKVEEALETSVLNVEDMTLELVSDVVKIVEVLLSTTDEIKLLVVVVYSTLELVELEVENVEDDVDELNEFVGVIV